ncbi:MAG: aminotransferase class I/II-fold pyridoxal phosphate-dependent enzyme [Rhodospirillales bacterium]
MTSSLTKAYGLSGLRCGWILAPAGLAERMRRLNDLFSVLPPHLPDVLPCSPSIGCKPCERAPTP